MNSNDQKTDTATTSVVHLSCGHCKRNFSLPFDVSTQTHVCSRCDNTTTIHFYPGMGAGPESNKPDTTPVVSNESSCFYHPETQAKTHCDHCGRFLCDLCDIELHGKHICGNCLYEGAESEKIETLITQRTRYDTIALMLAIIPMLLFKLWVITAPVTFLLCIIRWNTSNSLVYNTRWRMVLALVISGFQLIGTGAVLITIASNLL